MAILEELEVGQRTVRLDWPTHDIDLLASNDVEVRRGRSVHKEPGTVKWMEQRIRDGDMFYDVGANIGAYALIAGHLVGEGRVIAFEPFAMNYAALCANVVMNSMTGRITALNLALDEGNRLVNLEAKNFIAGSAGHSLQHKPGAYSHPVFIWSLDSLRSVFGLPRPNLIKIDVDGWELKVIKGMRRTLMDEAVRSVLIEIKKGSENESQITTLMKAAGHGLVAEHPLQTQGLFMYQFDRERTVTAPAEPEPVAIDRDGKIKVDKIAEAF